MQHAACSAPHACHLREGGVGDEGGPGRAVRSWPERWMKPELYHRSAEGGLVVIDCYLWHQL